MRPRFPSAVVLATPLIATLITVRPPVTVWPEDPLALPRRSVMRPTRMRLAPAHDQRAVGARESGGDGRVGRTVVAQGKGPEETEDSEYVPAWTASVTASWTATLPELTSLATVTTPERHGHGLYPRPLRPPSQWPSCLHSRAVRDLVRGLLSALARKNRWTTARWLSGVMSGLRDGCLASDLP
ncbi:hypothetical protein GCM10010341_67850 [Streptomyces noursei]|nr:hypothetical protein GCM10010341_67850 [Streptomyces noursei]